jgi:hydrogenase-1 operon protein HyaF
MKTTAVSQFNIHIGNEPTLNVQPILHQVRHALDKLLHADEPGIIDLRSIPLAPGEEQNIIDALGQGEIYAHLDALGSSEIYETRYAGVWLVTHKNEEDIIVSRFIEINYIPDILKSQHEDISLAAHRLAQDLKR